MIPLKNIITNSTYQTKKIMINLKNELMIKANAQLLTIIESSKKSIIHF